MDVTSMIKVKTMLWSLPTLIPLSSGLVSAFV